MRLKSATIRNMKPIFRSSGLNEIYIDFTKCVHDIILIVGPNGSGKSTIMNALQPLPESPTLYLDGKDGEKILEYYLDDLMYTIRIIYPVSDSNKKRLQTKAFIYKTLPDGTTMDLNPNGNIGSYKEAVYNEFRLDGNFVTLSQLSSENRGIVEKTPSERKKYVSSILQDVQVFNDINKALVKRSSIFKSMCNSITAKIESIGDRELLIHEVDKINKAIINIQIQIDNCINTLSTFKARICVLDENGTIQSEYKELFDKRTLLEDQLKILNSNTVKFQKKYPNLEFVLDRFKELEDNITKVSFRLQSDKDKLNDYLASRDEEYASFQKKKQKLESMNSEMVYEDIEKRIKELEENVKRYKNIIDKTGITDLSINKEEYILGLNTMNELRDLVVNMKSFSYQKDIEDSINMIKNGSEQLSYMKDNNEQNIERLKDDLYNDRNDLSYYKGLSDTAEILDRRPSGCKDDMCPFIRNAVEANSKKPNENIERLEEEIENIQDKLSELYDEKKEIENLSNTYQYIKNIVRIIKSNSMILSKMPNGDIFGNIDLFLSNVLNGNTFNEVLELYKYIEYSNVFDIYRQDKEELMKMKYELKLHENKVSIIKELDEELKELQNKISNITSVISKYQDSIYESTKILEDNQKEILTLKYVKEMYEKINEVNIQIQDIEDKLSKYKDSMLEISGCLENISLYEQQLNELNSKINPLKEERDKVKYNLNRLEEYYKELEVYNEKYNMTEIVKRYSSPTKGGIQTLFVRLYMGKTLEMANEILSYFFNGDLVILPYEINENEFRIPCKNMNSSVINDDISSCSNAEKSMISMILSMALMMQSSTKYNILKLDEIDGALDARNRSQFIPVVKLINQSMGIENCLMVSHSSELDLNEADIIQLAPGEYLNSYGKNIIFKY